MAINFRSNTIIKNLRVGPLSGGGNGGGGGGSSEPSYLAVGAYGVNSGTGAAYVFDATDYSATPTKLVPTGLSTGGSLGWSITATSNQIVIGAPYDNANGSIAGAVYVYDANNLSSTPTKLAPSELNAYDEFGYSVAATSNHIIVGARSQEKNSTYDVGSIYVYDANNLSDTPTKLQPSTFDTSDYFGHSVAASDNKIVVGAYNDDDQGTNTGAVYVYDVNNLATNPVKLAPSDLTAHGQFGYSVAATSNHIVVGNWKGDSTGAVYVYDANNLSAIPTKLSPSDLDNDDHFGNSVAATSNHLIVGAYLDEAGSTGNTGAAYVYDINNLSTTPTKLAPSGLGASDMFGHSVAAFSNQIAIAAREDDDQGSNAGAVYVYDATNLSATPTKLTPSDLSTNSRFGQSVSLG